MRDHWFCYLWIALGPDILMGDLALCLALPLHFCGLWCIFQIASEVHRAMSLGFLPTLAYSDCCYGPAGHTVMVRSIGNTSKGGRSLFQSSVPCSQYHAYNIEMS